MTKCVIVFLSEILLIKLLMKKLLVIPAIIVSLLAGSVAYAVHAPNFIDLPPDADYWSSIEWMAENGVIQGYPDKTFQPDRCVNRAEFLKMLYLTLQTNIIVEDGFAGSNYYDDFFSDTFTNEWYWPYVEQALRDEAIEGYPDGTFRPEQCVNRAEAIKMATLAFEIYSEEAGIGREDLYKDVAPGEFWFDSYVYSIVDRNAVGKKHVVLDSGDYYFYPGDSMSRKEVAEMLYRIKALKDNNAFGYIEKFTPDPLNYYLSPSTGVTFMMPEDWVVTYDGFYTTAGGVEADYPTIYFSGPEENPEDQDVTVSINQRMMNCSGELYAAQCFELNQNYTIGAYDPDIYASQLMNMVMLTFRDPGLDTAWQVYNNEDFKLSFNYPVGWQIAHEEEIEQGNYNQLRLSLMHQDIQGLSIGINTPPIETGYENAIIEEGIVRPIEGLTQNRDWFASHDFDDHVFASNAYYIDENDWNSHIELFFWAPDKGTYDSKLDNYLFVLDSLNFQNSSEVAFDGCGEIADYNQEDWFTDFVNTWDQAVLDGTIDGVPIVHDFSDEESSEGCLALDGSMFVFIPSYVIDDGGKIINYDIVNNVLEQAQYETNYFALEFGARVGDYIEFTGSGFDMENNCYETTGFYYYLENRVMHNTQTCDPVF